jgi:N-acetylated-alpha-linked acidic dipeptidase
MPFVYRSVPNAESALNASRKMATHPHLAGDATDYSDAKVMLQLFQSEFQIHVPHKIPLFQAGSQESQKATLDLISAKSASAWIDVYYPILNTPLDRSLDILDIKGKSIWSADLVEDGDPLDPEAARYKDAVPAFHGLSRGGEAEGQLVYANYGTQEDYAKLVNAGVNFTGKIVMTRYGGIFRGLKVRS